MSRGLLCFEVRSLPFFRERQVQPIRPSRQTVSISLHYRYMLGVLFCLLLLLPCNPTCCFPGVIGITGKCIKLHGVRPEFNEHHKRRQYLQSFLTFILAFLNSCSTLVPHSSSLEEESTKSDVYCICNLVVHQIAILIASIY